MNSLSTTVRFLKAMLIMATLAASGSSLAQTCSATPALFSGSFTPFNNLSRLEVRSGRPNNADWQWGLGVNTQQAGQFTPAYRNWINAQPYGFTLTYDAAGNASLTVSSNGTALFTRTWSGGLQSGNAIQFYAKTSAGIGAGNFITLTIASINGSALNQSLQTAGDNNFDQVSAVYAGTGLAAGFTVQGSIAFTFTGSAPPTGSRLDALVSAGNVACPQQAQPQLYYIHPDQLNTPRIITNQAQQVVWRWDNDDAFGGNVANSNPGGLGTFTFNLRFPGQYFDKETNNHYNYYRDYSPDIGRYVESDPIGTVLFRDMAFRNIGRISLVALELGDFLYSERPKYAFSYTYVRSNPLSYTDPLGLAENACTPTPQATSSNLIVAAAGGGCTWTGFSVPSIDSYTGKGTVKCQYRCPDGSLQYRTHSSILGCPETALF